jgi:hypothetical protein
MGSGGGKNFVAKPVMGANIFSQRLAVYFDNSPTMLPFIERVEAEIRDKFPDADVYLYSNVLIRVEDGEIAWGDKSKTAPTVVRNTPTGVKKNAKTGMIEGVETVPSKLTRAGQNILKKFGNNFRAGSLGAFLDILKDDPAYDAIIVISDFSVAENGIHQTRVKAIGNISAYKPDKGMIPEPPVVFSERRNQSGGFARSVTLVASGGASGQPVVQCKDTTGLILGMVALGAGIPQGTTVTEIKDNVSFTLSKPLTAAPTGRIVCSNGRDLRFPEERKWEDAWEKVFARARDDKAPRLYLISTSRAYGNRPGTILQRCVSASDGAAIIIKFGDGKKGEPTIHNMTPNFAGGVRGNGTVEDFDDIYVGMPISGKGVPPGAVVVENPLYKDIKDAAGDPKRVQVRPMKISMPLTEDSTNVAFTFTPLVQAVGTLAKDSKTIEDVSGSVDLKTGMIVQDNRFPAGTKIMAIVPNKNTPGFFTVEMSAPATAAGANVLLRFRPASSGAAAGSRGAAPTR